MLLRPVIAELIFIPIELIDIFELLLFNASKWWSFLSKEEALFWGVKVERKHVTFDAIHFLKC